jgi:hypothetical protein
MLPQHLPVSRRNSLIAIAAVALIGVFLLRRDPMPPDVGPTLDDWWAGRAQWVIDVADTGLPEGESDTIYMGDGEYWSYLHASSQSAGIVDSCGDPVEFPGCVTRWISTDGGRSFALSAPTCIMACNQCPCGMYDYTRQQQYPRVVRDGSEWFMVFEHGAGTYLTTSRDGLTWVTPWPVPYTGVWTIEEGHCPDDMRIGEHPYANNPDDCMAGGPPGIMLTDAAMYVFMGFGQNPAHMGCFWSLRAMRRFGRCLTGTLLDGASEYGPLEVVAGAAVNPYYDFRYLTSADVVRVGDYYYMSFEGIRGPTPGSGGDSQFALGFARTDRLDSKWTPYRGNPVLGDVAYNWGVGHADLVIAEGVTYMYTASPEMKRARYVLRWVGE